MWTVKVQMSVPIRAVWWGHSLFVDMYYSIHCYGRGQRRPWSDCVNGQADQGLHCPQSDQLHQCTGWSEPALSTVRKDFFCVLCIIWVCGTYEPQGEDDVYDDYDEFRFNITSTHEGHLHQNGELSWFYLLTWVPRTRLIPVCTSV